MDKLLPVLKNWIETSSLKQKWTAALFVFSILCTLGLLALKGMSPASGNPLETTPLYFLSVFVKLILVLLLIFVSSVVFRRWLQPGFTGKKNRQVQLLETVRLSPKQALHLISVGDQQLLVGATDQGISLITQVELDLDAVENEPVSASGTDFSSVLQTFNFPNRTDKS